MNDVNATSKSGMIVTVSVTSKKYNDVLKQQMKIKIHT